MSIVDIYGLHWDIALRRGWHELESDGESVFRWARSGAEIMIFTFEPTRQRVVLDLEAGPGVSSSCDFTVADGTGRPLLVEHLAGRKTIAVSLAASEPTVHVLQLEGAGAGRIVPSDPRVLDFRIFSIDLEPEPSDVVAVESGCRVGAGWYPLETWQGTRFRWVDNDARIVVEDGAAGGLVLDLEPGPGMRNGALDVLAREASGAVLAAYRLAGRQRVVIPLPPEIARPFEVVLHADGGGKAAPDDPRVLNFRAFCDHV